MMIPRGTTIVLLEELPRMAVEGEDDFLRSFFGCTGVIVLLLLADQLTHNRLILVISIASGLAVEPNFDDDVGGVGGRNTQESIFNLAEQAGSSTGGEGEVDGSDDVIRRTITMYRDGFIVDDGPYRRLDDPANAPFLRALAVGQTPPELMMDVAGTSGGGITVGLIDKRSEDYVETFRSFSGAGNALGDTTTTTTTDAGQNNDGVFDSSTLPETPPPIDDSQPTTSIAVRLPNGQRKVVKVNLSMTVSQVAAHIRPILPEPTMTFRIVSGFPPKPLTDVTATVEASGLKGAQVQIKKA
jgi:UBX domain-containing protein 1